MTRKRRGVRGGAALRPLRPRSSSSLQHLRPVALLTRVVQKLSHILAAKGFAVRGLVWREPSSERDLRLDETAHAPHLLTRFEIPVHDNDGEPFDEEILVGVFYELWHFAGGLTFFEQAGLWLDAKTRVVYLDASFGIELWTRDLPRLKELLARLAAKLSQEAIALRTFPGVTVDFIAPRSQTEGSR